MEVGPTMLGRELQSLMFLYKINNIYNELVARE